MPLIGAHDSFAVAAPAPLSGRFLTNFVRGCQAAPHPTFCQAWLLDYCKKGNYLLTEMRRRELVANLTGKFSRRIARHFSELFDEMRLIIIVFVEVALQRVEGLAPGPPAVKFLKAKDASKDFRWQAYVLLEELIQIAPGVTSLLRELPDRDPPICRPQSVDAILNDRITTSILSQE